MFKIESFCPLEFLNWDKLHKNMNDERSYTEAPAGDSLSFSDRGDLKKCTSESVSC